MKNKRGQFGINALAGVAITVVVVAMVSVLGLQLLGDTQDDLTANSAEYNATDDAIDGVAKIPAKLPLIVGAVVLVVTITIIVIAFRSVQ